MTAAARQSRYRRRLARGKVVLQIEADWCALAQALAAAGFLPADSMDDRDELARALGHVVKLWCEK